MSLNLPSRRLLQSASTLSPSSSANPVNASLLVAFQSLSVTTHNQNARGFHSTPANQWFWGRKKNTKKEDHIEKEFTGTQEGRRKLYDRLGSRIEGESIFEDEVVAKKPESASESKRSKRGVETRKVKRPVNVAPTGASLARDHLARSIDPDPRSRVRWERKMVIRQIRNGTDAFSREPRDLRIARSERELTTKSSWLPTSTKKLVKLAHQIQGKTVADALAQMRYSQKKMAREVKFELQRARDQAIVERGMGLGLQPGPDGQTPEYKEVTVQTKDGKFVKIDDPTRMYVAQAWVNRGPFGQPKVDHRARGQFHLQWKPMTSISVVLKEEKTRIREHEERVAKKLRRKPWVHLPDRPVTAQRPYYSW